jgi:hypothetical protein
MLHTHLHLHVKLTSKAAERWFGSCPLVGTAYEKDKWAKPGNLPKSNALSEIGKH